MDTSIQSILEAVSAISIQAAALNDLAAAGDATDVESRGGKAGKADLCRL